MNQPIAIITPNYLGKKEYPIRSMIWGKDSILQFDINTIAGTFSFFRDVKGKSNDEFICANDQSIKAKLKSNVTDDQRDLAKYKG